MKSWNVERKALADMRPASYNPRKITEAAFSGLGGSLEKFGLLVPLVWNRRTGNLVAGHQRYRWLVEQGEEEADVVVVDLDEHEEVALNITLNNRAARGEFTDDVRTALAKTEARIGSVFNEIGLSDLRAMLGATTRPKGKKDVGSAGAGGTGTHDEPGGSPASPMGPTEPDALVVCPKCGSKWKMKNNEVVYNAVAEQVGDASGQVG